MLKLERRGVDRGIILTIRERESFFSSSLVIALIVAAGFHLLFFLFFSVSPFSLNLIDTLLSPVDVEADLPVIAGVDTTLDEVTVSHAIYGIMAPSFSRPKVPDYAKRGETSLLDEKGSFDGLLYIAVGVFDEEEKKGYVPFLDVSVVKQPSSIQCVLSGPLAEWLLVQKETLIHGIEKGGTERLLYNVYVEGRSGKIFWFEPKEVKHSSPYRKEVENFLKNIQFVPDRMVGIIEGSVEVRI